MQAAAARCGVARAAAAGRRARGGQSRSRRVIVGLAGLAVSLDGMKWIVAAVLLGVGVSKLLRARHPRWGGMAVGDWQVGVWSFLMASAHGAGLMIAPVSAAALSTGERRHACRACGLAC
jgi:hypothetical protein